MWCRSSWASLGPGGPALGCPGDPGEPCGPSPPGGPGGPSGPGRPPSPGGPGGQGSLPCPGVLMDQVVLDKYSQCAVPNWVPPVLYA